MKDKDKDSISIGVLMEKLDKLDDLNDNIKKLSEIPDDWSRTKFQFVSNEIYNLRHDLNNLRSIIDRIKMNAPGLTR